MSPFASASDKGDIFLKRSGGIDKLIDKMSPFASAFDKGDIFLKRSGGIDKLNDKMSPFASASDKGDIFLKRNGGIDKLIDKLPHLASVFRYFRCKSLVRSIPVELPPDSGFSESSGYVLKLDLLVP